MRAVLWIAVSSGAQAEDDKVSLIEQERALRDLGAARGWQVIDLLTVPGFSRRYYNFPEFAEAAAAAGVDAGLRLMEHWRRRDFDVFACWSSDRFGRGQAILAEVVERTIDTGAVLYLYKDGEINRSNYRMFAAMSGFSSAGEIDKFVERARAGKRKRVDAGLPYTAGLPASHKLERDPKTGKGVRVVVDEATRPVMHAIALLLLDGVGWNAMPAALAAQGYTRPGGQPYSNTYAYQAFHNPFFGGHAARGYGHVAYRRKKLVYAAWVWDESAEPPPGVVIVYDTHEPALTGDLAIAVKAELARRNMVVQGRTRPDTTHMLSGLLVCRRCGRFMKYSSGSRETIGYYRCLNTPTHARCDNRRMIREDAAAAVLSTYLERMLAEADALESEPAPLAMTAAVERAKVEAQIRALIRQQADANDTLADFYRAEIDNLTTRLKSLEKREFEEQVQIAAQAHRNAQRARTLEQMDSLELFWSQTHRVINQALHAIFAGVVFVVDDGEIVAIADSPRTTWRRNK